MLPTEAVCPSCGRREQQGGRCSACGVALRAGGFRIIKVIGDGASGRVYLAQDKDGHDVALKELLFAKVPDASVLDAFERESRILAQLNHPQIPRFVSCFQQGEGVRLRLYLAQQYVAGTSLKASLNDQRFTEADAMDLARQVLGIVVYLQSLSPPVFHRDIKPQNLIRGKDGGLVLVDFGAARELGATAGATLVGTFGYMPPEQLSGIVDETTDLYALGATLVHLLKRRPPWEVLGQEPMAQHLSLSPPFVAFLERLVAGHDKRFANARQALGALGAVERGDALVAPAVTRQRSRRQLPLLAVGGAVAGAAMYLMTGRPAPQPPPMQQQLAAASQLEHLPSQQVRPAPSRPAGLPLALKPVPEDTPWWVKLRSSGGLNGQRSRINKAQVVSATASEAYIYLDYQYQGERGPEATVCATTLLEGHGRASGMCKPTGVRQGRGFATVALGTSDQGADGAHTDAVIIQMYGQDGRSFAVGAFEYERTWQRAGTD